MRRSRQAAAAALAVAWALVAVAPGAAKEVPYLTGRVNDYADLIPAETEARIEAKLAALESATGAQVAVLTVESLDGEVLEEYSLKVAETWALGRAEEDDGLLLLVARDDRKMRLEVGYGLEGRLTDLQSGRILNNILRPRFREGDFGGGIEAGVDAIVGTLQGEDVVPPDPPPSGGSGISDAPWLFRLVFVGIFLLVVGTFSTAALFGSGCHSWFLWLFLTPFWSAFPMVLHPMAGAICGLSWLIGFPILKLFFGKTDAGQAFLDAHPALTTFASSGWRSGGGSGGGWSGGGFSGGGGSFGGGGASSSW